MLKDEAKSTWNDKCQKAFGDLRSYLWNPPIPAPPVPSRPLLLYVSTTEESVGVVLAQYDDTNKE